MKAPLLQMSDEEENLFYSIEGDDYIAVEQGIKRGVSVNTFYRSTSSAWSALHICAEKGRYKCAEALLKHGAEIDSTDTWGQSPLMYAIVSEWMELIGLFLKYGANVNIADSHGHTPLHLSLNCSDNNSMKKLCQAGADLNKKDVLGRTPLWHTASKDGRVSQLKYLLSLGADPNVVDAKDKFTPLQAALWYTDVDQATYLSILMEAGKSQSLSPCDSGNSALMTLIQRHWNQGEDLSPEDSALAQKMIAAGCDVNVCAMRGLYRGIRLWNRMRRGTALKMAAHRGAVTMVKILLEAGANPDLQDADGVTALHMAVYYNHADCTRLLIGSNAKLDHRAQFYLQNDSRLVTDITPFGCALEAQNIFMAQLLIRAGYRLSTDRHILEIDRAPLFLKQNPEFLCWLISVLCETEDLKAICRREVRMYLGRKLTEKVDLLPLPTLIKNYLLLEDVLQ